MTAPPIITPLLQWSDADGHPYSGGSIECYVVGTSSPKQVWLDMEQTALATNPVILDAAGRSLMFGDGAYRLVLRDSVGNQVADFVATTLVSAAMYPVISAPTIADAVHLLGLDDTVTAAELASSVAVETARAEAAEGVLTTNLAAEVARAEAAEAHLQTEIDAIPTPGTGSATTVFGGVGNASGGHVRITFPTPYTTTLSVVATPSGGDYTPITTLIGFDNTGADIWINEVDHGPASDNVYWISIGVL